MDQNCHGSGNRLNARDVVASTSKMVRRGARTFGCCALITALGVVLSTPGHATVYSGFIGNLVTDSSKVFSPPSVSRPGYLAQTTDPTFNTKITRIANDSGNSMSPVSGSWDQLSRHHYSKEQPWNADGSLLALDNGTYLELVVLDGETYQPRYGQCGGYPRWDDRWHPAPAHANERINAWGTQLMWWNVVTCTKTRTWSLPFSVDGMGMGEGNPSADGRFVALSDGYRVFVVDMDPQAPYTAYPSKRLGPALDVSTCGLSDGCDVDWVSISASGKYVIVNYSGDHPRVYDVNPSTLALTPRPLPANSNVCSGGSPSQGYIYDLGHADLGVNPFDSNEDVLVGQDGCSNIGNTIGGKLIGGVVMVRLRDGAISPVSSPTNEAYPHHVSMRASDRPGWAYVTYNTSPGERFSNEIVAVKMDGSRAVQRFAHMHSDITDCYECQGHAVPSRDGRRVLWASNWAQNCATCGPFSEIKDYIADARGSSAPPPPPPPGGANMVTDPSFETGLTGWSGYQGAALLRSPGGFTGSYSLKVTNGATLATFGVNDSPNWVSTVHTLGTVYHMEAWVRSDLSRGSAKLMVREYLNGSSLGSPAYSTPLTLSGTWQKLSVNYTARGVGSTVDLQVIDVPVASGESFTVDDVVITASGPGTISVNPDEEIGPALSLSIAPNPMRSNTTFSVTLPLPGPIRVDLYDPAGRRVRQVWDEPWMPAGRHSVPLSDALRGEAPLAPGIYLARAVTESGIVTQRFVVLH